MGVEGGLAGLAGPLIGILLVLLWPSGTKTIWTSNPIRRNSRR